MDFLEIQIAFRYTQNYREDTEHETSRERFNLEIAELIVHLRPSVEGNSSCYADPSPAFNFVPIQ